MTSLARKLGVSKNTVSLAFKHDPQIPARTRERVFALARESGYVINPVVSHLMAELRRGRPAGESRYTIALLNAYKGKDAFRTHPTIPSYVEGCRRRAAQLGYGTDVFWLRDPELDAARLNRVLAARGIRGLIVIGSMEDNTLPPKYLETWKQHACVVTGVRTHAPALCYCSVDHHALVLQAFEQARLLGYQRPGLVIEERIDRLVEGRFSAGMWRAQQALPKKHQVPAFLDVDGARQNPKAFYQWLDREKPDVIFTLYTVVQRLVEAHGLRVPHDIGLIQLERRGDSRAWAGMDQHNDLVGEAAVDMVVGLIHKSGFGIPQTPYATLINPTWSPGWTVREPAAVAQA